MLKNKLPVTGNILKRDCTTKSLFPLELCCFFFFFFFFFFGGGGGYNLALNCSTNSTVSTEWLNLPSNRGMIFKIGVRVLPRFGPKVIGRVKFLLKHGLDI